MTRRRGQLGPGARDVVPFPDRVHRMHHAPGGVVELARQLRVAPLRCSVISSREVGPGRYPAQRATVCVEQQHAVPRASKANRPHLNRARGGGLYHLAQHIHGARNYPIRVLRRAVGHVGGIATRGLRDHAGSRRVENALRRRGADLKACDYGISHGHHTPAPPPLPAAACPARRGRCRRTAGSRHARCRPRSGASRRR
ncbi:MAG: hypothetical protein BWY85_00577 [Firmicutes bacterium ADurb.Bin506]|nr:MAG: hypothetical protein BWY85_00577 [Firmicutes bacterium ADurb.Bin506]